MRLIFQYTYVPPCDKPINLDDIKDTMRVVYSPVIAHEIIDSSRKVNPSQVSQIIQQFTESTKKDTIANQTGLIYDSSIVHKDSLDILPQDKMMAFKYYPNPTSGKLNIEIEGALEMLYLTDISGKLLERYKIEQSLFTVDLSNYPTGIYFLRMLINKKWQSGKVILVR